jgi:uncharacterized membrane protein
VERVEQSPPPIPHFLFPDWAGLVFAATFLLYLPVEYMNLYEFQIRAFATTALLWALWAQERQRFWPFLIWSLLALGCRSEAGLVLAGMGLAQFKMQHAELRKEQVSTGAESSAFCILHSAFAKFGLLPIALGLGWFGLCLAVLIPYFRGGAPSLYLSVIYGQIDGRPWLGDNPGAIVRTLVTRPGFVLSEVFGNPTRGPMRLRYLLEMFLPFGFLLLLQPRMLLITLPIFALNLLSNTPNIHASTHYHYQALIIPFMVVGSAYGLEWLLRRNDERRTTNDERVSSVRSSSFTVHRCALAGILALALLCNIGFRNPFFALLTRPIDRARTAAAERLLAQIPPDAPLATTSTLGPHASRREWIFFFPGNVIYPEAKIAQAQYLLIDRIELLQDAKTRAERERLLADIASSGRYRRLAEEQGIVLWQRAGP